MCFLEKSKISRPFACPLFLIETPFDGFKIPLCFAFLVDGILFGLVEFLASLVQLGLVALNVGILLEEIGGQMVLDASNTGPKFEEDQMMVPLCFQTLVLELPDLSFLVLPLIVQDPDLVVNVGIGDFLATTRTLEIRQLGNTMTMKWMATIGDVMFRRRHISKTNGTYGCLVRFHCISWGTWGTRWQNGQGWWWWWCGVCGFEFGEQSHHLGGGIRRI